MCAWIYFIETKFAVRIVSSTGREQVKESILSFETGWRNI